MSGACADIGICATSRAVGIGGCATYVGGLAWRTASADQLRLCVRPLGWELQLGAKRQNAQSAQNASHPRVRRRRRSAAPRRRVPPPGVRPAELVDGRALRLGRAVSLGGARRGEPIPALRRRRRECRQSPARSSLVISESLTPLWNGGVVVVEAAAILELCKTVRLPCLDNMADAGGAGGGAPERGELWPCPCI